MWEMYLLLLQQEPLFVCLFVTWHLTSWPWSRVSKQRADVDVIDLWGGLWPRPNQERHNCLTPQRDTHTHTLAVSALLWTTKCRISWTEMLNIHVSTYIHVVYKYALCPYSASPLLCFSVNAAAAAKLCINCISKDCPQIWDLLKKCVCQMWVHCKFFTGRRK